MSQNRAALQVCRTLPDRNTAELDEIESELDELERLGQELDFSDHGQRLQAKSSLPGSSRSMVGCTKPAAEQGYRPAENIDLGAAVSRSNSGGCNTIVLRSETTRGRVYPLADWVVFDV